MKPEQTTKKSTATSISFNDDNDDLTTIGLQKSKNASSLFVSQAGEVASFLGAPYVDRFDRFTLGKFGSSPFEATPKQSFGREPEPRHVALAMALNQQKTNPKDPPMPPLYFHDDFAAIEAIARAIAARVSTEAPTWFYYNNVLIPIGYHSLTYQHHDETRSPQQTALAMATEIWLKAKSQHLKKIGSVTKTAGHAFRLYHQGDWLTPLMPKAKATLSLKKWSFKIKKFGNESLRQNTQSNDPLNVDLYAVPINVLFTAYGPETGVSILYGSNVDRLPLVNNPQDTHLSKVTITYSTNASNAKPVSTEKKTSDLIQASPDSIRQAFDRILAYARSTENPIQTISNMYIPIFTRRSPKNSYKNKANDIAKDLWKNDVSTETIIEQLIISKMKIAHPDIAFVSVMQPLDLSLYPPKKNLHEITFKFVNHGEAAIKITNGNSPTVDSAKSQLLFTLDGFELNRLTPAQRDHLELLTPHIFVGKNEKDYDYYQKPIDA